DGGLELKWNQNYQGRYKDVQLDFFYSDGTSKKSWEKFDFVLEDLSHKFQECDGDFNDNKVKISGWQRTSSFSINGFDRNRDVIVAYKVTDASVEIPLFSDKDREIVLKQTNDTAKIILSLNTGQGITPVSEFQIPERCPITAVETLFGHGFNANGRYGVYLKLEVGEDPKTSTSVFVNISSEGVFLCNQGQKIELEDDFDFWNLDIKKALELMKL
ncbi:hypothetical protein N9370_04305, partial [Paracoccaceae bacterium]|nr:hypothetical protein [Paracoccaceae bacterium]